MKVYHAGDTGLMAGMETIIGDYYQPDLAILPIGGVFTMGPEDAAYAMQLLKAKYVIPQHYASFPVLEKTPDRFIKYMKQYAPNAKVFPLKPGEPLRLGK